MNPSMLLFLDISGGELAIIALIVFIVLGPDKMPEMARKFGRAMRFIRKATEDIKREINIEEDLVQKARSYSIPNKTASVEKKPEDNNDENIIQKDRSYSYPNKTSPVEKKPKAKTTKSNTKDPISESEDNKKDN